MRKRAVSTAWIRRSASSPRFDPVLARIDRLVPGEGPLAQRVDAFMDRFVIPRERLDAVMRAAIAECRRRTVAHIPVPPGESFTLEFVTGRSWSGYNWYQGNYHSLIQVNTDQPVRMGRAIDLGCHEGYPGHHVVQHAAGANAVARSRLGRVLGLSALFAAELHRRGHRQLRDRARLSRRRAARLRASRALSAGRPLRRKARNAYLQLQDAIRDLSGARIAIARDLLEGGSTGRRRSPHPSATA